MEALAQLAFSNLVLSAMLAALAWAVHRDGRYPGLAHALWVLTLVKTLTPPLLVLPLAPGQPGTVAIAAGGGAAELVPGWLAAAGLAILPLAWLSGSAIVLLVSLLRIRRFDRFVAATSVAAPEDVQSMARAVAARLGLRRTPTILVAAGGVSPMTWWTGGSVRVILPAELLRLGPEPTCWALAHELAHVRRRDHLVRWLEWLACVACWWNPVVWWTVRRLREDEEIGCDALVLHRIGGQPRSYGRALLAVVELLSARTTRPPLLATGFDDASALERRLRSIVSPDRRTGAPRPLAYGLATASLLLMALGLGAAEPPPAPARGPSASGQATALAGPVGARDLPAATQNAGEPGDTDDPADAGFALLSAKLAGRDAAGTTPSGRLIGGGGADVLRGGPGADVLVGGRGADVLRGGRGADRIRGGGGRDTIAAGPGDDDVRAWRDGRPDRIDCGPGTGDRAVVDRSDVTVGCEVVIVREPATT